MRRCFYAKTTVILVVLVLAAILGAVIAGCEEEATETTAGPIKIGVPVALSGMYAGDGQNSLQGIQMAVKEINDAGGLVGRPVEIVTFDIQDLAPELVTRAADQLVGSDKVDAVITGWSGFGGDVQAFGKYDVPFLNSDAQQAAVDVMKEGGFENVFFGCEVEKDTGAEAWEFISWLPYEWPSKTVAFIHSDDNWAGTIYDTIQAAAEADGWEVVSRDLLPYGTIQWDAILTRIRAADPALIMFDLQSATDMLTFVQTFKANPSNSLVYLGTGLPIREFQEAAAGEIDGFLGLTDVARGAPFPPISEGQNAWFEAFTEEFGVRPGGLAGMTYTETRAWAQAVEAVGDPSDYAAINEWLANNEFVVWDGVPPFRFDEDHVNRSNYLYFGQVQGGEMMSLEAGGQAYTDYQGNTYELEIPSWVTQ